MAMPDPHEIATSAGDTGSWFPLVDEEDLPPDLQGPVRQGARAPGVRAQRVPGIRVSSRAAERVVFATIRQLHQPTEHLSAADREMVAVVVSAANGCLYCLVAHGAALREELGDPVLGERISYDWRRADLDPRRAAICAYAEKLTLRPREVTPGGPSNPARRRPDVRGGLGCGGDRRDVQPDQPDGDGHQHAAQRGVQRSGSAKMIASRRSHEVLPSVPMRCLRAVSAAVSATR